MSYKILSLVLVILLAVVLGGCKKKVSNTTQQQSQPTSQSQVEGFTFNTPKKAAHWESNTPSHAAVLAGVPVNVVIDFNFDLASNSQINISKGGADVAAGVTVIDDNKLAMRRSIKAGNGDGLYKVSYNACWPDGSCHDGTFEFAVSSSKGTSYIDMTSKDSVVIDLKDILFKPMDVKIKTGTRVTWTNSDNIEHFVNTDSHPAHTYFKDQNSSALATGESYSLTYDTPGIYPYHCSAHASGMVGNILVVA